MLLNDPIVLIELIHFRDTSFRCILVSEDRIKVTPVINNNITVLLPWAALFGNQIDIHCRVESVSVERHNVLRPCAIVSENQRAILVNY